MATRELAILLAVKGALKAAQDIGKVDSKVKGLGGTASRVGKIAAVGVGAAAGAAAIVVGRGVKAGLDSLAALENASAQVQGAINQVGLAGQVTAAQVAGWANDIEAKIGAAFDDKDITSATATLLRFGKVTPSNLRPAIEVMTDLAAKTGSVDSAATLLAKALADPAKAAGRLSRAGIVLTKEQQKQITAMVKAGDAAGAQKVLLDELAKTTAGAAAATQGPYQRSLSVLRDVTEDAQRALAEGFLPVIEKVRDVLSRELAKPQTLQNIRDFGKSLAGGLDKLVTIVTGLPWDSIKSAFQVIGTGSKALLDAFTGLPPWVQTAVLTGWGLNKLTGGAVGSIVGELGKGLVKGVLGMTAGVVNIKAGTVVGGGVPGIGDKAGGAGRAPSVLATGLKLIPVVTAGVLVGEALAEFNRANGITPRNLREEQFNRITADGKVMGSAVDRNRAAIESAHRSEISELRMGTSAGHADTQRIVDAIDRIKINASVRTTIIDKGDPGSRYRSNTTISSTGPSGVSGPGHGA